MITTSPTKGRGVCSPPLLLCLSLRLRTYSFDHLDHIASLYQRMNWALFLRSGSCVWWAPNSGSWVGLRCNIELGVSTGNSTFSSRQLRGHPFMAISTSSTTSDNSLQVNVPFPTALQKADLNMPISLSN